MPRCLGPRCYITYLAKIKQLQFGKHLFHEGYCSLVFTTHDDNNYL